MHTGTFSFMLTPLLLGLIFQLTLVQNRFCEFRLGQHLASHDRRPLNFLSVKQPLDAGFGDS